MNHTYIDTLRALNNAHRALDYAVLMKREQDIPYCAVKVARMDAANRLAVSMHNSKVLAESLLTKVSVPAANAGITGNESCVSEAEFDAIMEQCFPSNPAELTDLSDVEFEAQGAQYRDKREMMLSAYAEPGDDYGRVYAFQLKLVTETDSVLFGEYMTDTDANLAIQEMRLEAIQQGMKSGRWVIELDGEILKSYAF